MNPLTQTEIDNSNDQDLLLSAEMGDIDVSERSGDPQLIAYARLLWPQRMLIAKATLAGLLAGCLIALLIPRTYEATVQLMPPDSATLSGSSTLLGMIMGGMANGTSGSGSSGSSAGGLAGAVGDLLGNQRPGPLLIGILTSRTLSDHIIDRFDLRKIYGKKTYIATRKKLLSRTAFQEDKKSGIISMAIRDRDPSRATAMAQAYIDELNRVLSVVNNSAASREREFLEHRLAEMNLELQSATKDLSEFSSKNATLDPENQGKAMLDAAAILQGQLVAARSELSGLEQIYTSENVRVRSLRAHITELEQQVNELGGKGYSGSDKLDPNALYPSVRQLPVLDRQYADLYRRAKVDETVFQLLTEAYEMAKVQEAKDTPSAKVLDAPKMPERPSNLPRPFVAVLLAFVTLIGTSVWLIADQQWSRQDPYRQFLTEVVTGTRQQLRDLNLSFRTFISQRRNSAKSVSSADETTDS